MINNEEKNKIKLGIIPSNKFNKQLKKMVKQGKKIEKLKEIVKKLANKETLDIKNKDHALNDTKYFKGCRECHIEPDWLLIYKIDNNKLILYLMLTGSHSDLFNM